MSSSSLKFGQVVPLVGLGTWKSLPGQVGKAVDVALKAGYRHFDCASIYENESEIGEIFERTFKEGKIKREDLFIVSKLWANDWGRVREGAEKTIKDLKCGYLDLYLVHTPVSFEYIEGNKFPRHPNGVMKLGKVPVHKMWPEMEKLVDDGLTKSIGISNFPTILIHDLLTYARIKPVVHQLEIHPYFTQKENAEYCLSQGIEITAYAPLASGREGPLNDPYVKQLASKYSVSPAQVLIRWSIQRGYIVIPKSVTEARIKENFNVFGFSLSKEEIVGLEKLDRGFRSCDLSELWEWPLYS